MTSNINLPEDWLNLLQEEFQKPYFQKIKLFLKQEIQNQQVFFPPPKHIFEAFNQTNLQDLKVVILGQDPYHSVEFQDSQKIPHAHGLSFSIPVHAKKVPPSLKNIYKEIREDIGKDRFIIPTHGNLTKWANQGVLLLNSTLTVRAHQANSHSKIGWQEFTDTVIKKISQNTERKVFILWGNYARSKRDIIDSSKHLIIESPHPSPFSANKGFFGSKPFSKTNQYLEKTNQDTIDWQA